ncbi:RNA-binding protein [Propionivibrio sp.]|uniref:RNA recognition motif domain-containing protein n=1 Tax=Propionivibrio sp. TaxID=2212460 RepID=UPI002620ACD1|nr:RNA-binding protein [Propionivibrio sp.]
MKTVFIGALPFRATEEFIHDLIQPYRPDGPIEIFADWSYPTFEPYALVSLDDAERAVDELDGRKFGATHLRVHLRGE